MFSLIKRKLDGSLSLCNLKSNLISRLVVSVSAAVFVAGYAGIAFSMAGPPAGTDGEAPGAGAMLQSFMPLILIFVIFYFLLIRPQSKKAKEHKAMLENLKKGDKVMTTGGIFGLIEDIDETACTLKVGVKEDVKIKVSRSHIADLRAGK